MDDLIVLRASEIATIVRQAVREEIKDMLSNNSVKSFNYRDEEFVTYDIVLDYLKISRSTLDRKIGDSTFIREYPFGNSKPGIKWGQVRKYKEGLS